MISRIRIASPQRNASRAAAPTMSADAAGGLTGCWSRVMVLSLVVVGGLGLVHCLAWSTAASAQQRQRAAPPAAAGSTGQVSQKLSVQAREMREAIITAAESGRIDEMRTALDWNELKPDVAPEPVADVIAYWRSISATGDGREILAAMLTVLAGAPAVVLGGHDPENSRLFIWPAVAEADFSALSEAQRAALAAIATPDQIERMVTERRYLGWRLVIGADGVWHSFRLMN